MNVTGVSNWLNMVAVRVGNIEPSSQLSLAVQVAGVPISFQVPSNSPRLPQRADSSRTAVLIVLASFWYMAAALVGERTVLKSLLTWSANICRKSGLASSCTKSCVGLPVVSRLRMLVVVPCSIPSPSQSWKMNPVPAVVL